MLGQPLATWCKQQNFSPRLAPSPGTSCGWLSAEENLFRLSASDVGHKARTQRNNCLILLVLCSLNPCSCNRRGLSKLKISVSSCLLWEMVFARLSKMGRSSICCHQFAVLDCQRWEEVRFVATSLRCWIVNDGKKYDLLPPVCARLPKMRRSTICYLGF